MVVSQFEMLTQETFANNNNTCLTPHSNSTSFITKSYQGIPETLLLNLVAWIFLLLLFTCLRHRAWDYGRLALVQNEKWTQLFYKNTEDAVAVEETTADSSIISDSGCFSWYPTVFSINRQRISARCGPDAAHYLSFQRHLLALSLIIMLFSVCVILPINFQGDLQGGVYSFGHTTLSNLDPNSKFLWVHLIASFALVPITVLIMKRCSSRIPTATLLSSRTVMVTHISHNHRSAEDIRSYFSVRFPNVEIKDVQITYKIKELMDLECQRQCAQRAKNFCIVNNKLDIPVQPYGCILCCPWHTENAIDYYSSEEDRLNRLVLLKKMEALEHPLGIAFVTVQSEEAAQYILETFVPGTRFHWNIIKAPSPSDIQWENLQVSSRHWYSKAIFINSFLFIVLFFLTTPAIIVNLLTTLTATRDNIIKTFSPVISEFLPTLLLLLMSALMPVIVSYSDQWMSYWTKSKQNKATMQKTFYFLLFMVLILPSLGLTSAQALLESSLQPKNSTYKWECVFLPDKGAFFVNYVITSSLIGSALELLRFPELAMYLWRLLIAKSEAEKLSIQKEILVEFPFGIHYAWTLLIFTTSTVYCLTCPLITPFALLYLCLKHLVDKHNLYFVYQPSSMCGEGQQIHITAVTNVRVAVVLLQVIMAGFAFLRGGSRVMSIMAMLGLITTCSFFFLLPAFPSCKRATVKINNFPELHEQYIAPVFITSRIVDQSESSPTSQSDYGSSHVNNHIIT